MKCKFKHNFLCWWDGVKLPQWPLVTRKRFEYVSAVRQRVINSQSSLIRLHEGWMNKMREENKILKGDIRKLEDELLELKNEKSNRS